MDDVVFDRILREPEGGEDGLVRILIDGAPTILRYSSGTAEEEVARWVQAVYAEDWVPRPDPDGFLLALLTTFGGAALRGFLGKYGDFFVAILAHDYAAARSVVQQARQAGDLGAQAAQTIGALADQYHLPSA